MTPIEEDFIGDKATIEWLKAQKLSTQNVYKYIWKRFLKFTGLSGDQILASRKEDKEKLWEKKVMEFKDWVLSQEKSENLGRLGTATVRSFFTFHFVELKFRRTESQKLTKAQRKYEDYRFSLDDFKKMFDVADLTEKYVLTAGKSFGMRASDFMALTRGDLQPYLDRPVPISLGEMPTKKEKIPAYPFIDSDALPVIKLMIDTMTREGRIDPSEKILTYKEEIQLSRILKRLVEKAGINVGNKRVRFHCLRKFLIDHLSSYMSESKWKQIVGKKISESAYISPDTLREDYARAMTETTFTKAVSEDVELLAEKKAMETLAKLMNIPEERRKLLLRQIKGTKTRKDLDRIAEKMRNENQTNGGQACANGHCDETFEQIPESQLLTYLKAGWQIVHRLESGEVIVKR